MKGSGACAAHRERAAIVRCFGCGARLCDECFRFVSRGEPLCELCAYEVSSRRDRRLSVPVVMLGLGSSLAFAAMRKGWFDGSMAALGVGFTAALGLGAFLFFKNDGREISSRDVPFEPPAESPRVAHHYRQQVRNVTARLGPRISGKATSLSMIVAALLAFGLLPKWLNLDRFVEIELALGVYWVVTSAVLTTLLFRGVRIDHDYVFVPPWRTAARRASSIADVTPSGRGLGVLDGCTGGEEVLFVIAAAVVSFALFGASWLIADFALPFVLYAGYWGFSRAIARALKDAHGCEGHLGTSLLWGGAWSLLYLSPLFALCIAASRAFRWFS